MEAFEFMETKICQELNDLIKQLNLKTQEAKTLGLKVEIILPSSFDSEPKISLMIYKPISL